MGFMLSLCCLVVVLPAGFMCWVLSCWFYLLVLVVTCNEANICDSNAECVYNYETRRYECQCREGFSGDGEVCETHVDGKCL